MLYAAVSHGSLQVTRDAHAQLTQFDCALLRELQDDIRTVLQQKRGQVEHLPLRCFGLSMTDDITQVLLQIDARHVRLNIGALLVELDLFQARSDLICL